MISESDLGWLAGILDGEGSIGIYKRQPKGARSACYFPCVQMATTSEITAKHVSDLFGRVGAKGFRYRYDEKKPERHRPSHQVRVVRLLDVKLLCDVVGPHAIEKREQWRVVGEFCALRIDGRTAEDGRIVLPGPKRNGYGPLEIALWSEARVLNQRGIA